ncbi:hypothetical protein RclHR1_00040006 [Rhizophagus clarus]|uniref:RNA-dependent RNA polymerase n=1 Tax=Rhizophagus clarus TaxID=94130 RepID=A0A2Z6RRK5_9GLOM|nr:hypothetical protein RclHR1_00040006 [Rhizophagus clarus]GES91684.1 RNA-dependent RNA polymerase [Rhizophagus clarus]
MILEIGWDFSTNKIVDKYAVRMGQCLSSICAIQYLPVDEKRFPTLSDGVGRISFSSTKKVAEKLELKDNSERFPI